MTMTTIRTRAITLNGRPVTTAAATLDALIADEGLAEARVATAVNQEFVPANRRAETVIADGDRIEIVSARQGG